MSDVDLALRTAEQEWSLRSAEGSLDGLHWVDIRLHPDLPPLRQTGWGDKGVFHHFPYMAFMPTHVVDEALEAQARGTATAWEALSLVFATSEWTIASRSLLWTPGSPYPTLLGRLVGAFGIETDLHQYNPEALARLTAMLPNWHPQRGALSAARAVLAAIGCPEQMDGIAGRGESKAESHLRHEILTCRTEAWWRARSVDQPKPQYRIQDGAVRFQPESGPLYGMRTEDCIVEVGADVKLPVDVFRLLPVWAVFRPTSRPCSTEEAQEASHAIQ